MIRVKPQEHVATAYPQAWPLETTLDVYKHAGWDPPYVEFSLSQAAG